MSREKDLDMEKESEGDLDLEKFEDKNLKEIHNVGIGSEKFKQLENEFYTFSQELFKDRNLEKFRVEYEKVHKMLKSAYEKENILIKRCRELNQEIYQNATNVRAALKMTQADADQIQSLKREVDSTWALVDKSREREETDKDAIAKLKNEITRLARLLEQPAGSTLKENEILKEMLKEKEELLKRSSEQMGKISELHESNSNLLKRKKELEKELDDKLKEIEKFQHNIKDNKSETDSGEKLKKKLNVDMEKKKHEIEEEKKRLMGKDMELKELEKENENLKRHVEETESEVAMYTEKKRQNDDVQNFLVKRSEHEQTSQNYLITQTGSQALMIKVLTTQVEELQNQNAKMSKEILFLQKKNKHIDETKRNHEIRKGSLRDDIKSYIIILENMRKVVEEDRSLIEEKMRARDLLNKRVVKSEEKQKLQEDLEMTHKNQLKKLDNEIQAYKTEAEKLNKIISQLENDKRKYGIEASQANAKYYHCLEEVKLKTTFINDLQKKNFEAEAKLKQQQNLYEAVRSDRNLYSKNLIEAQEEISDLQRKYKRMTHQIDQLKEEIATKDAALIKETKKNTDINSENDALTGDIKRMSNKIKVEDDIIKTHESDIARLKNAITQAEQERQKQRKDYEMVINERDILGNQLIKRNDELGILYEKIKIQQSTLAKGNIRYIQTMNDITAIKSTISRLKREILVSEQEISCIDDLKKEIHLLSKEVLEERLKAKVLEEELGKPMNVHKWRKLEGTDPETYDMIMKIHSLQRRLIAKTEEVAEKDVLIQEKEKLYVELKNILAKQSGPEVAEKLEIYQQNLKDRMKQLKTYLKELSAYQSQVNAYKFEIERVNSEVLDLKRLWFEKKRQEELGMHGGETIPEEVEPQMETAEEIDLEVEVPQSLIRDPNLLIQQQQMQEQQKIEAQRMQKQQAASELKQEPAIDPFEKATTGEPQIADLSQPPQPEEIPEGEELAPGIEPTPSQQPQEKKHSEEDDMVQQ